MDTKISSLTAAEGDLSTQGRLCRCSSPTLLATKYCPKPLISSTRDRWRLYQVNNHNHFFRELFMHMNSNTKIVKDSPWYNKIMTPWRSTNRGNKAFRWTSKQYPHSTRLSCDTPGFRRCLLHRYLNKQNIRNISTCKWIYNSNFESSFYVFTDFSFLTKRV